MPRTKPERLTVANLRNVATDLERTAAALRVRIDALEQDEILELDVENYFSLQKGMEFLEGFVSAVRKAHLKWRESEGAYRKEDSSKPEPKGRKK